MRISAARHLARQGMLDVTFENGDHFLVAVESVLSKPVRALEWAKMRLGETSDVLEVPSMGKLIEIPWDRIRSVADPDFRAHLAGGADQRLRRLGQRIRSMRLEANLTRRELAGKLGISQDVLAKLETGKVDASTELLEHVAQVLGKRLRDFAMD